MALTLEVSMTGTGTIGNIAPGWSLNESATPVTIGERGAGTGSVSFTAQATDDSLLVINNDVTSSINGLGTIVGNIQSVSQSGLSCQITHNTYLDKFNLDVDVPAISVGGVKSWFDALGIAAGLKQANPDSRPDYRQPKYVIGGVQLPANDYWKIGQVTYGFPFDDSPTDNTNVFSIDDIFKHSTRKSAPSYNYGFAYENANLSSTLDAALAETRTDSFLPGMEVTSYIDGNGNYTIGNNVFQMAVDVDSTTDIRLWVKVGAELSAPTYANVFGMEIDGAADVAKIYDLQTETTRTVSLATLDHSQPILISFNITHRSISSFPTPIAYDTLDVYAKDYTNATATATGTYPEIVTNWGGGNLYVAGDYINCANIAYVNFFRTKTPRNTAPTIVYYAPEDVDYFYNIDFTGYTGTYEGAYPATTGVAWELIQDLASAENFEVYTEGNVLYLRDIGSTTVDITNRTVPNINPTSTLSGKQINIAYSEAEFVNGVVYDAAQDGNNIITVEAGTSTVTSVKWNVNPLSVQNPVRSDTWPVEVGQYYVIDSEGLPLLAEEWEAYGASVTAIVDPDDSSAIQITVKGPSTDTTLAGGPYKLAASDSGVEYGALKLGGSGVYVGGKQLGLITAVDPEKYTRATVNTIINPFIVTEENAYDRGVWASMVASGPTVSVSFTLPVSAIDGVGLTPGALFDFNHSTYRVVSSSIGNLGVGINAERYVLVSDVDAIWGSQTVADFDAVWGALECQDQIIFPYKVA